MTKPKLYSTAEAADYVGLAEETLKYHIYKRQHLAADYTIGGDLIFLQATLDDFKAKHQAEGVTIQEAADALGVDRNWVHNHVYNTKRLTAIGKRGKFWIYDPTDVEALRPLAEEHHARKAKSAN